MYWYQRKGLVIRNSHVKYQSHQKLWPRLQVLLAKFEVFVTTNVHLRYQSIQQGALTPPWHLIPLLILVYLEVYVRPFSDLYFL
jgi:hypothetical protein